MTKYHYPTWADVIGTQYKYFENWAKGGCGNVFIFNSVIECDLRHIFSQEDTVLVMWTQHGRHDFFQKDKWIGINNAWPDWSDWSMAKPFCCLTGYEMLNYALIHSLNHYLSSKNVNFKFLRWMDWDMDSKVYKLYQDSLSIVDLVNMKFNSKKYDPWVTTEQSLKTRIEDLYHKLSGPDWPSLQNILEGRFATTDSFITNEVNKFKEYIELETTNYKKSMTKPAKIDHHPLPSEHLRAAKQIIPQIEYSDAINDWISKADRYVLYRQAFDFVASNPVRF